VTEAVRTTQGMVDFRLDGNDYDQRAPAASLARANGRTRRNPSLAEVKKRAKALGLPLSAGGKRFSKDELLQAVEREERARLARRSLEERRYRPEVEPGVRSFSETDLGKRPERTTPIRKDVQRAALGEDSVLARTRSGLAVFTKPDAPRLVSDPASGEFRYCGNPIDGQAYYAVIKNERVQLSPFVRWDELYGRLALSRGVPKPLDYGTGNQPLRARRSAESLLVADPEDLSVIGTSKNEDFLGRALRDERARIPALRLDPAYFELYAEMISNLVRRGLELRKPNGRKVRVAGLYTRKSPTGKWNLVSEQVRGQFAKKFIGAGNYVLVVVPSYELIQDLNRTYESLHAEAEAAGLEVFATAVKGTQLVGSRPGKRRRATETILKRARGMSAEDYAPSKLPSGKFIVEIVDKYRAGPAPEQRLGRKGSPRTITPDEGADYAYIPMEGGKLLYPRIKAQALNPNLLSLMQFKLYEAVGEQKGNKQKDKSPFFSWVRAYEGTMPGKTDPVCLTPKQTKLLKNLKKLRRALFRLQGFQNSVFRASQELLSNPEYRVNAAKTLRRLASAVGSLDRIWNTTLKEYGRGWRSSEPLKLMSDLGITTFLREADSLGLKSDRFDPKVTLDRVLKQARKQKWSGSREALDFLLEGMAMEGGPTHHPLYRFWLRLKNAPVLQDDAGRLGLDWLVSDATYRSGVQPYLLTLYPSSRDDRLPRPIATWEQGVLSVYRSENAQQLLGFSTAQLIRDQNVVSLLASSYRDRIRAGTTKKGTVYKDQSAIDAELAEAILLLFLYSLLQELFPAGEAADDLTVRIEELGGPPALGRASEENYTVYKTYNPLLYNYTRMYWPRVPRNEDDIYWPTARREVALGIDTMGTYGVAAEVVQQGLTLFGAEDEEELREEVTDILQQGPYRRLLASLQWGNVIQGLEEDPLGTLATLKTSAMQAAAVLPSRVGGAPGLRMDEQNARVVVPELDLGYQDQQQWILRSSGGQYAKVLDSLIDDLDDYV
jgi:hypothetical protein